MVGLGGVSPDVMSPGQAAVFCMSWMGESELPIDFLRCPHHPLQASRTEPPLRGKRFRMGSVLIYSMHAAVLLSVGSESRFTH